jgi:hypothetical protein
VLEQVRCGVHGSSAAAAGALRRPAAVLGAGFLTSLSWWMGATSITETPVWQGKCLEAAAAQGFAQSLLSLFMHLTRNTDVPASHPMRPIHNAPPTLHQYIIDPEWYPDIPTFWVGGQDTDGAELEPFWASGALPLVPQLPWEVRGSAAAFLDKRRGNPFYKHAPGDPLYRLVRFCFGRACDLALLPSINATVIAQQLQHCGRHTLPLLGQVVVTSKISKLASQLRPVAGPWPRRWGWELGGLLGHIMCLFHSTHPLCAVLRCTHPNPHAGGCPCLAGSHICQAARLRPRPPAALARQRPRRRQLWEDVRLGDLLQQPGR